MTRTAAKRSRRFTAVATFHIAGERDERTGLTLWRPWLGARVGGDREPRCVGIFDLWDAKEHLWEVDKGRPRAAAPNVHTVVAAGLQALEEGRGDDVLSALRHHTETSDEVGIARAVEGSRRRMSYPRSAAWACAFSSGTIEISCKGFVGRVLQALRACAGAWPAQTPVLDFNDRHDDFWQPPGQAPPLAV